MMETKQEVLLCRVISNHLFLSQFEPFRASLHTLYEINPALALAILQVVIQNGGEIEGILWSDTVPSSAHLVWLCLGELSHLEGDRKFSSRTRKAPWVLDPHLIFDNVEFVLLVERLGRLSATRALTLIQESEGKLWELGRDDFRKFGENVSDRSASTSGTGQIRKSEGTSLGLGGRLNETFEGLAAAAKRVSSTESRRQGIETSTGEGTSQVEGEASRESETGVLTGATAKTGQGSDKARLEEGEGDSENVEAAARELEEAGVHLLEELSAAGLERLSERIKFLDSLYGENRADDDDVREDAQLDGAQHEDATQGVGHSTSKEADGSEGQPREKVLEQNENIQFGEPSAESNPRETLLVEDEELGTTLPEKHSVWVRKLTLYHPELLQALCSNIQRQQRVRLSSPQLDRIRLFDSPTDDPFANEPGNQADDPGQNERVVLGPYFSPEGHKFELGIVLGKQVQNAHLDQMKEDIREGRLSRAAQHLRYLNDGFGIAESQYREVLRMIMKGAKRNMDPGRSPQDRINDAPVLWIYEQVIASCCANLSLLAESAQDDLILEEAEERRGVAEQALPPPLEKLHKQLQRPRSVTSTSIVSTDASAIRTCKVEMFQYARVMGAHVLETVVEAAFTSIKALQLQKTADVLAPFPRLQPLVTVMGWDLLSGNTAARRRLVELLWTSRQKSGRLDGGSIPGRPSEEESCVEELCYQLCYRLELAYFAALVNSGASWQAGGEKIFGSSKGKVIGRNQEDQPPADPFVANLVLERLAMHSPIRVIFDVVPNIKLQDALQLVEMQPTGSSTTASFQRQQDLELLHMHFGIQAAVQTIGFMEASNSDDKKTQSYKWANYFVLELQQHLDAVTTPFRKLWMMDVIVALLHMDELSLSAGVNQVLVQSDEEPSNIAGSSNVLANEDKPSAVAFVGGILSMLRQAMSSVGLESQGKRKLKQGLSGSPQEGNSTNIALPDGISKAWEQKTSFIQTFVDDWEWRLEVLQRLSPSSQHQWQWKQALALLRAAPSTLLNMCVQRAQYDLGEEVVNRFSLPPEEAASLQLAERVDRAVSRSSVDDPVSHVVEGGSSADEEWNIAAFQSPPLAPLASILLCLDVAAASAKSVDVANHLLGQARTILLQISQGVLQRQLTTLEQRQEACLVLVAKRVLQRLQDLLEQDQDRVLRATLSGTDFISFGVETGRQGPKQRLLVTLHQVIEEAHDGKRQFLSGKLHNLVKVLTNEEVDETNSKQVTFLSDRKQMLMEHVLGLGFHISPKHVVIPQTASADHVEGNILAGRVAGKGFLGPLGNKPMAYLSAFILYVATVGDIVDGADTTHDYNFFSLVYERPNDLLTRLVFERRSADAAGKVAEIMGADLVHQIISACVPPVYPPKSGKGWACVPRLPSRVVQSAGAAPSSILPPNILGEDKVELYPLQRDVIKHLATLSPVRAILACVFGSSRFTVHPREVDVDAISPMERFQQQSDADRWFFEFALEQSERFSTLNRWIQLQANHQRLSDSHMTTRRLNDVDALKDEERRSTKRAREPKEEMESDDEHEKNSILNIQGSVSGWDGSSRAAAEKASLDPIESKASPPGASFSVLLDWENEGPSEEAVGRLMEEGKLLDALALADRCLRDGASDKLLQMLIEKKDRVLPQSRQGQDRVGSLYKFWDISWQYCIRLRDKRLAATLALQYQDRWELDAAIDVFTMCCCHLDPNDSLYEEVIRVKQSLQQYGRILRADSQFRSWIEVRNSCNEDPEGLALRLASKGAVSAALDVAESFKLPSGIRRELQGRQLVKLLTSDPTTGGGPAEGLRFLGSLQQPEDALAVAMAAMEQLPNLGSKQLLVHFFLKRQIGTLSEEEHARLDRLALGLRMLGALPLPWQQRCSALHEHPSLILETLLMWKQLRAASQLVEAFPSLRDNDLIISYAAKAITFSSTPYPERQSFTPSTVNKPASRLKSNHTTGVSSIQREAKRAWSWTTRDTAVKVVPKETPSRKRKDSMLPPSQIAAWEAMAGIPDERQTLHGASSTLEGYERLAPVTMGNESVLTGDPTKDNFVRKKHHYESAPSAILFKALLSLCSEEAVAAKAAVDICITQIKKLLNAEQLPLDASSEVKERAFHATEAFVQALLHARAQLRNLVDQSQATSPISVSVGDSSEAKESLEETQNQSSTMFSDSPQTDKLPELLKLADVWLNRVELLQSLLGSGVTASLDDLVDENSAAKLRDRLIDGERYNMAVYTCTKCKIDALPVWEAWGHALLRIEHYAQARVKFTQALRLLKGDPAPFVRQVIHTMEAGPPVAVSTARKLYVDSAQHVSSSADDSLSADSYLNVLYILPSFSKSDRSRRSSEDSADGSANGSANFNGDDHIPSNLDRVRYEECVHYLQEYARQDLLDFTFRHGRYSDGCLLFFPPDSVPPPPRQVVTRPDPLATDYGSVDDLCDYLVSYGAVPVLERILLSRTTSLDPAVSQHTALALTRICTFCEVHRHFNHLYRFQVLKKDYVAAGLCCIQLFLNSSQLDQGLRHLERAKGHFEDGLAARQQAGDGKGVSKGLRGKLPSDKLTEEELLKFNARITMQMDVVRTLYDTETPLWKWSLFGNPNDADTFKRRCDVAEALVEKNFELTFQIIVDFGLPAVHIYAGVAASLATKKKGAQLSELLRNIKALIEQDDFDQVLGAAINVYAGRKERPDRLIDMLSSSHRKVLACVICGRLKSAFQFASRSNSVSDVQYVAQMASLSGNLVVHELAKQWLEKHAY